MGQMIDLTGKTFGRWTVLGRADGRPNHRIVFWRCQCRCGNLGIVASAKLRENKSKSCGCLAKETTSARFKKHGGTSTRLYRVWDGMKERCTNSAHKDWESYGGKSVSVCNEWLNFENFNTWAVSNGYDKNAEHMECTIDRIDYEKGYCPSNCRFVGMLIQNRNKPARADNKSGTKGVYWHKRNKKWTSDIGVNYKRIHLGYFGTKEEAVEARKSAELKYWGIL